MILRLTEGETKAQLERQLTSLYPLSEEERAAVGGAWDGAMSRVERCFSHVRNKYYSRDGETLFDPLHGCQWAHFLYVLSNEIFLRGGGALRVRQDLRAEQGA